jgi:hypothetical protein
MAVCETCGNHYDKAFQGTVFAQQSLTSKNGFLAPARDGARDRFARVRLRIWKTDFGVLLLPFCRVCTKNLSPDVMVMKPTEDGVRHNGTDPLNRARNWRVFIQ